MDKKWRCFHCDEVFTTAGGAEDHFGNYQGVKPGCVVKVELGGERGLLMALREAESIVAKQLEEETFLWKELRNSQSRHSDALQAAEEAGYARGIRDINNIKALDKPN